jgi:hypothetical protein
VRSACRRVQFPIYLPRPELLRPLEEDDPLLLRPEDEEEDPLLRPEDEEEPLL